MPPDTGILTVSTAEWQSKSYDARSGAPDPPLSQLLLWKEKACFRRHVDGLDRHLGEVDKPRFPGPKGGNDGSVCSRGSYLGDQVVE
jgi:hypothetical protein